MTEQPRQPMSIGAGLDTIGQSLCWIGVFWFLVQIGGCIERSNVRKEHPQAIIP